MLDLPIPLLAPVHAAVNILGDPDWDEGMEMFGGSPTPQTWAFLVIGIKRATDVALAGKVAALVCGLHTRTLCDIKVWYL